MRRAALLVLLLAAAAASGCYGFRPLYGAPSGAAAGELEAIQIAAIPGRLGQVVRNGLLDRLTPFGEPASPRFVLSVSLSEAKQGSALERNARVTRFSLNLTANYDLTDAATHRRITGGLVRATAAYSVVSSPFANVIAERDARDRTASDIADEIKTRLAVHFVADGP